MQRPIGLNLLLIGLLVQGLVDIHWVQASAKRSEKEANFTAIYSIGNESCNSKSTVTGSNPIAVDQLINDLGEVRKQSKKKKSVRFAKVPSAKEIRKAKDAMIAELRDNQELSPGEIEELLDTSARRREKSIRAKAKGTTVQKLGRRYEPSAEKVRLGNIRAEQAHASAVMFAKLEKKYRKLVKLAEEVKSRDMEIEILAKLKRWILRYNFALDSLKDINSKEMFDSEIHLKFEDEKETFKNLFKEAKHREDKSRK